LLGGYTIFHLTISREKTMFDKIVQLYNLVRLIGFIIVWSVIEALGGERSRKKQNYVEILKKGGTHV
jgi:hypothetical protein